ncbi:OtsA Trehalose-6-phosphate synthase [Oxalobacteraceae bacterium]
MPIRPLQLSLRFILPLALVIGLSALILLPMVDDLTQRWFLRDLDTRGQMVAASIREPLIDYVMLQDVDAMQDLLERAAMDGHLLALGFCDASGNLRYRSRALPHQVNCRGAVPSAMRVSEVPVEQGGVSLGKLLLAQDTGFIQRRSDEFRFYLSAVFLLMFLVISALVVWIAHWSWLGWVSALKNLLRLETTSPTGRATPPEFRPLVGDLRAMLHQMQIDRRVQQHSPQSWTPQKLRSLLHDELAGDEVLVVSNREPYIHEQGEHGIVVRRPASGLVTAVEPVMRACSGTWIAHGSGSADRATVDAHDRVQVPPARPAYTLRRVWLSSKEEQGYYYGFSNEGLWPLCHIAHVRPVFRTEDWEQYVAVNQRFADAVIAEANTDDPVVLVQDYHFALLPRMVREKLPKATIIMFWHIPWPNPESFGICPWREELLEGLLGNTLLGFHTPFHCKNFLETVDRYLETRIEHEASTISYGGELTQVEPYPISIAWPESETELDVFQCRNELRESLNLPGDHRIALGVDRLDYTKGIVERFQAVDRLLELRPELIGRFSLLQIAAPSRSSLDEYQNLEARVRKLAQEINQRYLNPVAPPIILRIEYYDADQLATCYRAADICLVTSLHDGMNLVAKEFIAARDDELGVLILSQFTGAARELHEALIINPYHIEQGAQALYRALTMPAAEQRERMRSMRTLVRDFNVYRWAGLMLLDAARLRRRQRVTEKIHLHSRHPLRRAV